MRIKKRKTRLDGCEPYATLSAMTPTTTWTLSPLFEDVKNPDQLREWLMRAYFNPEKHSKEAYYNSLVSKENVLEYVSDSDHNFPQTPFSITGVWHVMSTLREDLKSITLDVDTEKEAIYTKGEMTLAKIGEAIGGVSTTMVNKISDGAVLKITSLLRAMNSENTWLVQEAEDRIESATLNAAEIFADSIQNSTNPQETLENIAKSGLATVSDLVSLCDTVETEAFQELLDYKAEGATQSDLEDVFLADIRKPVNVFNTFQLLVARQVFPQGKKGRPKASDAK